MVSSLHQPDLPADTIDLSSGFDNGLRISGEEVRVDATLKPVVLGDHAVRQIDSIEVQGMMLLTIHTVHPMPQFLMDTPLGTSQKFMLS
jgi:hypothetical protein